MVVNNQSTTTVGNISTGQNSTVKIGTTEVQASKPYTVCPKATLYRSERSLRRGSGRGMDLASLGHLDLPALNSTEPFLLIQFALGLHFYELENYWLAARFFKASAEHVLATERNVETLDVMLGQVYLVLPDPERSLLHSRRALDRVRGSGNEMEGLLVNNIGGALLVQGEYEGALEHFRRALAIDEKAHGKDHHSVAIRLNNIGNALKEQGAYAGALEHLRRALAIDEQALGKDHPSVAKVLNNIGSALDAQGEYATALEHYRRALAIVEKVFGPAYPAAQFIRGNIARATALKNAQPSDGK